VNFNALLNLYELTVTHHKIQCTGKNGETSKYQREIEL